MNKTKVCSKCKVERSVEDFSRRKKSVDGYQYKCRGCVGEYDKKYEKNNPEKRREHSKNYYQNNREKVRKHRKNYYQNNREKLREYNKKYCENNPEKRKEAEKTYHEKNPDYFNNYRKERCKDDDLFKFKLYMRTTMWRAFQPHGGKSKRTEELLGCSVEHARALLEAQFQEGMSWDNYGKGKGKWNIDHIIPLSSAKSEEDMCKLWHNSNLQPLWADDNIKKSNKIIWDSAGNR